METTKRNTFSVTFYLRKDKIKKSSKANKKENSEKKPENAPISMRITINGQRTDISTNRTWDPKNWSNGMPNNNVPGAKSLIKYLDSLKLRVFEIQRYFFDRKEIITAEKVKKHFQGKFEKSKTLCELIEDHNSRVSELIGKDYAKATYQRYMTNYRHIQEFLKTQYHCNDIYLTELKFEFISKLEHYLKTVRNCNHNSTVKYIRNFRKIINEAVKNDWLEKDPFSKYSTKLKEVERAYLSEDELKALESLKLGIERLDAVRDIFIFACYTGLSYIDAAKLSPENIIIDAEGKDCIYISRTKTNSKSFIPILPKTKEIIDKYQNHPAVKSKNVLLPVLSNQKMNAYLKELADLCSIKKNMTFHLARHTFATTVTLTNGVPIETVSSMLGHKSIRTTQHYSKVIQEKISRDMAILEKKLTEKKQK